MIPILLFLAAHWTLSVFCQTFFLHRYGAHSMFSMSKGWERFFHLLTFISQGASYLNPRAYALLHRQHHAFSDTDRDPHSPHIEPNFLVMMLKTKDRYQDLSHDRVEVEERFAQPAPPSWPLIDEFGRTWPCHVLFAGAYVAFYLAYAPSWHWYPLLAVHIMMGPIHGAIVNWGGHKYGYRNFETTADDRSKNTLVFDFLTFGELFQNNHHKYGMAPNFAARWFEVDPAYQIMRILAVLRIIDLGENPQKARYPAPGPQPAP